MVYPRKENSIKNLIIIALMLIGIFSGTLAAQTVDDLTLITEEFAPLNFEADGKLQGISVDVMVEMLKLAGSKKLREDIKLQPWARGYKTVQEEKNTVLFAMTRTPERENLFKWVGPIMPSNVVLIAKKDKGIKINSVEDIKKYQTIGVVREDVGEQMLLQVGVPEQFIHRTNNPQSAVQMLQHDRIEMWAYGRISAFWYLKQFGSNPNDYEEVYTLKNSDQYFAFHKDTDDQVIAQLQKAFEDLKASGRLQEIINQYLYSQ
jgi:ABC-type amino acid transport substrate-binding protein